MILRLGKIFSFEGLSKVFFYHPALEKGKTKNRRCEGVEVNWIWGDGVGDFD